MLVGHSNCGGAAACRDAALSGSNSPATDPLGRWLTPLIQLASTLELAQVEKGAGIAKLVDANVRKQVENIVASSVIQDAWKQGKSVRVHGLVYDLASGELKDCALELDATDVGVVYAVDSL